MSLLARKKCWWIHTYSLYLFFCCPYYTSSLSCKMKLPLNNPILSPPFLLKASSKAMLTTAHQSGELLLWALQFPSSYRLVKQQSWYYLSAGGTSSTKKWISILLDFSKQILEKYSRLSSLFAWVLRWRTQKLSILYSLIFRTYRRH